MTAVAPLMPDVDFGADPIEDFYARTAQMQAEGRRVAPVRFNGETGWLILRHGLALGDHHDRALFHDSD